MGAVTYPWLQAPYNAAIEPWFQTLQRLCYLPCSFSSTFYGRKMHDLCSFILPCFGTITGVVFIRYRYVCYYIFLQNNETEKIEKLRNWEKRSLEYVTIVWFLLVFYYQTGHKRYTFGISFIFILIDCFSYGSDKLVTQLSLSNFVF